MESKHTPGPWNLCFHLESHAKDDSCQCGFNGHIWGSDQEHVVCTIGSVELPGEEGMSPPRYDRRAEIANAHLIAAAPDLLEALRNLVALASQEMVDPIDVHEIYAARAAIAKATA